MPPDSQSFTPAKPRKYKFKEARSKACRLRKLAKAADKVWPAIILFEVTDHVVAVVEGKSVIRLLVLLLSIALLPCFSAADKTPHVFLVGAGENEAAPQGEEIVGRQVLCVVNFPPRQIGKYQSEVLTLGVPDENGNVVLLRPDRDVPVGGRLY